MENIESRKRALFDKAAKIEIKSEKAEPGHDTEILWEQYRGLYKAILIMGWESEYLDYCEKTFPVPIFVP